MTNQPLLDSFLREVMAVVSDWSKLLLKMTFDWSKLLSTCLMSFFTKHMIIPIYFPQLEAPVTAIKCCGEKLLLVILKLDY